MMIDYGKNGALRIVSTMISKNLKNTQDNEKIIKRDKIINANQKILNRKGNHLNGYFTRQKHYR